MSRTLLVMWGAVLLVLAPTPLLMAQESGAWPPYPGDPSTYGPGFYLAGYKLLLCWLLFMLWIKTSAWVNRDAQKVGASIGLPHTIWNPIVVFPFFVAVLLALWIPIFIVGFLLALFAWVVPLGIYIVQRNGRVMDEMKVLTPEHITSSILSFGRGSRESAMPHQLGAPVDFQATGRSEQETQNNLIMARQSPGYLIAKEVMADALGKRADRVMLDYSREAVSVRYEVDGVWHNFQPRDRENGDLMLAVFKTLSDLVPEERRKRQQGKFVSLYNGKKYACQLVSQGTKTGERAVVEIANQAETFASLEDIGMRDKLQEQMAGIIKQRSGIIILSALPDNGLRTMWRMVVKASDRYMREYVSIEDKARPMPTVENVEVQTYDTSAGETPDKMLPKLLLRQPDVLLVPDPQNAETLKILTEQALKEEKLVMISVRAKDTVDALQRLMAMKPPGDFAKAVIAVVNVRLVRRLAETCKQPFEPPPQLLKKLGIPQGRVPVMYREWQPPGPGQDPPKKQGPGACPFCGIVGPSCGGIGFKGRTGIFELLVVNDQVRKALVQQTTQADTLRQAARAAGCRSLQEEGILLVAKGITSLNELQRVLKQ